MILLLIISNGLIFLNGVWKTGLDILVEQDKIIDIKPTGTQKDSLVADAGGGYITPGFIDIHIHGSHGSDVMDGDFYALNNISTFIAGNGTTSFLATTVTSSIEATKKAVNNVSVYMKQNDGKGAQVLGVHLEGPFINPLAKGAHEEKYIIPPTIKAYTDITEESPDIIRLITMAPELEGAFELTKYLKERNVTVSIGHTKATYAKCLEGIKSGMTHSCHLYNAMSPLNHREPGAVGALLDNDSITIELIADLVHLHPAALRLAVQAKGKNRTVLITDALSAAGVSDGLYELGELAVYVKNGEARLKDGTLAGSTLTQNQALINMVKIGIPSEDVITMLTETPARVIGVDHYKGRLKKGYDADINILDRDLKVKSTFVRGLRQ